VSGTGAGDGAAVGAGGVADAAPVGTAPGSGKAAAGGLDCARATLGRALKRASEAPKTAAIFSPIATIKEPPQRLVKRAKTPSVRRRFTALARPWSAALLGVALSALLSHSAQATVVERVVAVIGDRAILLSDLKARAQPFLVQVTQGVQPGAQRSAAISQVYKGVLDKIVDEELEERVAIQAKVTVTAKEIDDAIARVAAQNQIPVSKLLAEAAKTGVTESQYRDELRRQLLQAKLVNVRLQGRIRVTDEDLKLAYRKIVMEERQKLSVKVAWIRIPADGSGRALAERVAEAARTQDFAQLARQFSQDRATRDLGGQLPQSKLADLPAAAARASLALEVGESSQPLRMGDDFVIVRVNSRADSQLPTFDEARRELGDRVYMDKMGQARRTWLDGLRRRNHVEVRL